MALTVSDIGALINDLKLEVASRFDGLPALMQGIVQENNNTIRNEIKDVSDKLNTQLVAVYDENLERDSRIDNLERLQLLSDLLIQGIPKMPNEDINTIFQTICTKIKFDIPVSYALTAIFRIKIDRSANKPSIIVKFVSQNSRNKFLQLFRKSKGLCLKDIGMDLDGRIFVNESLSKLNLQIFRYVMAYKKHTNIVGVTTYNGIVHVRLHKDDAYARILSIGSFDEILKSHHSSTSEFTEIVGAAPNLVSWAGSSSTAQETSVAQAVTSLQRSVSSPGGVVANTELFKKIPNTLHAPSTNPAASPTYSSNSVTSKKNSAQSSSPSIRTDSSTSGNNNNSQRILRNNKNTNTVQHKS